MSWTGKSIQSEAITNIISPLDVVVLHCMCATTNSCCARWKNNLKEWKKGLILIHLFLRYKKKLVTWFYTCHKMYHLCLFYFIFVNQHQLLFRFYRWNQYAWLCVNFLCAKAPVHWLHTWHFWQREQESSVLWFTGQDVEIRNRHLHLCFHRRHLHDGHQPREGSTADGGGIVAQSLRVESVW